MARKHSHKTWTYKEVRVVREGLATGKPPKQIAKEVGRNWRAFRVWLCRNWHLVGHRPFRERERILNNKVIEMLRIGESPDEIAQQLGVHRSTVHLRILKLIERKFVVREYNPNLKIGFRYFYRVTGARA